MLGYHILVNTITSERLSGLNKKTVLTSIKVHFRKKCCKYLVHKDRSTNKERNVYKSKSNNKINEDKLDTTLCQSSLN